MPMPWRAAGQCLHGGHGITEPVDSPRSWGIDEDGVGSLFSLLWVVSVSYTTSSLGVTAHMV